MRRLRQTKETQEGPIKTWLGSMFASMIFGVPTAILLVFLTNRELALWGPKGAYIGAMGFWSLILFFAITATVFPRLYPSMLGKIWRFIIQYER